MTFFKSKVILLPCMSIDPWVFTGPITLNFHNNFQINFRICIGCKTPFAPHHSSCLVIYTIGSNRRPRRRAAARIAAEKRDKRTRSSACNEYLNGENCPLPRSIPDSRHVRTSTNNGLQKVINLHFSWNFNTSTTSPLSFVADTLQRSWSWTCIHCMISGRVTAFPSLLTWFSSAPPPKTQGFESSDIQYFDGLISWNHDPLLTQKHLLLCLFRAVAWPRTNDRPPQCSCIWSSHSWIVPGTTS